VIEANGIKPSEIENIRAWVEGWVMEPLWTNTNIEHVTQAQFSMAHGLALGAHLIPSGKSWQKPEVVFDPSVLALMAKVECIEHPDYSSMIAANPASRPTRIEVRARGQVFVGESLYPKGSPTPDPTTRMTDAEIAAKFTRNAEGVLTDAQIKTFLDRLWSLELESDISNLLPLLSPQAGH
jgi:2-methylcitrate dehydratase PrpD